MTQGVGNNIITLITYFQSCLLVYCKKCNLNKCQIVVLTFFNGPSLASVAKNSEDTFTMINLGKLFLPNSTLLKVVYSALLMAVYPTLLMAVILPHSWQFILPYSWQLFCLTHGSLSCLSQCSLPCLAQDSYPATHGSLFSFACL